MSAPGRDFGQIAVAAGVTLIGAALGVGAYFLPAATGYSGVGPQLFPTLVALGLIVLGMLLLREALSGGFRALDAQAEGDHATDWRAFAWISAGLMLDGMLMKSVGFVPASTLLFVLTARAFGSVKYFRNALIGVIMSGSAYGFFNYVLGMTLPQGILPF